MRLIVLATLVASIGVLTGGATRAEAEAQEVGFRGWGPRLGLTFTPDQFHVGAEVDFGRIARHVRFQPNIEVGFGDNLTLVTTNFDAAYRFNEKWEVWTPYVGGGLGINYSRRDDTALPNRTSTDLGASVIGGIEKGLAGGDRFFVEARLGLTSASPDAMLGVGWIFYH